MTIRTAGDLVDALSRVDRDAPLSLAVAWAGDTATSDPGEVTVEQKDGVVSVRGWLSNCDTSLEVESDEDDEK